MFIGPRRNPESVEISVELSCLEGTSLEAKGNRFGTGQAGTRIPGAVSKSLLTAAGLQPDSWLGTSDLESMPF